NNFLYRLSQIISIAFHPIFMPLYGLLIIFSAPTILYFVPLKIKKLTLLVIACNNIILPLSLILMLYSRGIIKSFQAREKKERTIVLIISTILYLVTTTLILRLPIPNLIKVYFVSTTFVSFITLIINQFWRLSLHSVAVGGLLTLVCLMVYIFNVPVIWYISGMVLLSGLVMFSRLYNEDHEPAEVWTGFFAGAASMVGAFILLI
ncbi:MAG TPA: hypothetical protein PLP69_04630, partial [Bacteroidales bacterium]|nr:hypothetical protein [Bacteroidales bacterium]